MTQRILAIAALVSLGAAPAGPDHFRKGYGGPPRLHAKAEGPASEATRAQLPQSRAARVAEVLPEVHKLLVAFAERQRVPGIAYGVIVDGAVHIGVSGVMDVGTKAPVDADTVFRIASMTKSFTALCILKLRDDGKLSLDDPAEKYVPELARLKYPTTDSPKLTIRHLLTHSTGFPEDNPWGDQQLAASEAEFSAMMTSGVPFSNPPGIAYEYSNYGFAILGRIVTRVSGVPYATYVQSYILKPLGMTSTTLEPKSVAALRLARGYRWEDSQWKVEPPLPDGAFGAMGGMVTSSHDLAKYVAFLMSAWPARDGADPGPVKRSSLREMQQPWRPSPATVSGGTGTTPVVLNSGAYGYGLRIRQTCDYRQIVAHSGGLPGFGSQMRWLVDEGIGFFAMGNLTYTGWNGVLDQATDVLAKAGLVTRRAPVPSQALLAAKADVSALVSSWNDVLADRVAAVNLFLDESKDRRKRQIENYREQYGTCRADSAFDVENALRGAWNMTCERGSLRVAITLAPTIPPKVQFLSVQPAPATPPRRGCGQ